MRATTTRAPLGRRGVYCSPLCGVLNELQPHSESRPGWERSEGGTRCSSPRRRPSMPLSLSLCSHVRLAPARPTPRRYDGPRPAAPLKARPGRHCLPPRRLPRALERRLPAHLARASGARPCSHCCPPCVSSPRPLTPSTKAAPPPHSPGCPLPTSTSTNQGTTATSTTARLSTPGPSQASREPPSSPPSSNSPSRPSRASSLTARPSVRLPLSSFPSFVPPC